MKPVEIHGRAIARTWWGRKWCDDIESFADWSNRLSRGRSYCRGGNILDLDLDHYGSVRALVSGSRPIPYRVTVQIAPLDVEPYLALASCCSARFENVSELMEGRFPAGLEDIFQRTLFPRRSDIRYSCSCPDWASLCKHIASVLYGIGNRLDEDPGLIFSLRGIDLDLFLSRIIAGEADSIWSKAGKTAGHRIIPDSELPKLFGVDLMDDDAAPRCRQLPEGSALRLDRQTFIYSEGLFSGAVFIRDGRFVLASGAKVSAVTKRGCPPHIAAMRCEAGVKGSRAFIVRETLSFDSIADVTAFIRGASADISPWRTVFGVSYEETMARQAYLDAAD